MDSLIPWLPIGFEWAGMGSREKDDSICSQATSMPCCRQTMASYSFWYRNCLWVLGTTFALLLFKAMVS